jgi:hypothetical protein
LNITINFAGNLSDKGGPYWRPPGESVALAGPWEKGYYTNDSRQQENWMYINVSVTRPSGSGSEYIMFGISKVWLQWLNDTAWINWTYNFSEKGAFWEFNTSGIISTQEGHDYSFNVVANDSNYGISQCSWWNKTGISGHQTRRFVQLACNPVDITYIPLYLFNYTSGTGQTPTYILGDQATRDRLHHDQGPNGTLSDTGYLSHYDQILDDEIHLRYCTKFTAYFFEDSICTKSFELKNIYYHVWSACGDGNIQMNWFRTRASVFGNVGYDTINCNYNNSDSYVFWDNCLPNWSDDYYLCHGFKNSSRDENFSDNNFYEFVLQITNLHNTYISTICNRSINSFILLNILDNNTLKNMRSDSDGLTDWEELFVTFTNPFLADTDNDGFSDSYELSKGRDPNDFRDHA